MSSAKDTQRNFLKRSTDVNITPSVPFVNGDDGLFQNVKTTIEAIKQDVEAFIFTNKGERMMRPTFGCSIRKYLFDPSDDALQTSLQSEISEGLKKYFPFVQLKEVSVIIPAADKTLLDSEVRVVVSIGVKNIDDIEIVTIDRVIQTLM